MGIGKRPYGTQAMLFACTFLACLLLRFLAPRLANPPAMPAWMFYGSLGLGLASAAFAPFALRWLLSKRAVRNR